jgi:hypothetical protein
MMAFQIVFVVESDKVSKTDYMYIRTILLDYYNVLARKDVRITSIFMAGKGKYDQPKVLKDVNKAINAYKVNGDTYVIYCFDTDKYDSSPEDAQIIRTEEQFCKDKGYDFVWFCHDVEEVFLGHSIDSSEKTDAAKKYFANDKHRKIKIDSLKAKVYGKGKSNMISVLDKYLKK